MLYRCKECTLLRVRTEGETCGECKANMPQTRGNSTGWLLNPAWDHVALRPRHQEHHPAEAPKPAS